ncbi:MAG: glycosyltransferase family 87 protein [Acetobacteraceae bacterium]|jgi:hypothetical protein
MSLAFLRDAPWLSEARCTVYARIFLAVAVLTAVLLVALSSHGIDRYGRPLGTDFKSFWAASHLALVGRPASVYDPLTHAAAERAAFGGREVGYAAFFYPPPFLLVCLPLALLPYLAALAAWQIVTGFAWLRVLQVLLGWRAVVPILAFPAALLNLEHGQNGFLTAALFGMGALALRRRPMLAGVFLGCLVIKPQLLVLVPVLLLLRRDWRTIAVAAATGLILAASSLALFGIATWEGFLRAAPLARATLEQGLVEPGKMQSVFAAVRLLGGGVAAGYAAQGIVAFGVCGALVWVQRRRPDVIVMAMLTACGTLLTTPFVLDYDLTLLALPLAWLLSVGRRDGFLPWEKLGLAAGFVLPAVSRMLALGLDAPIAPFVLLALFALLLRRAAQPGPAVEQPNVQSPDSTILPAPSETVPPSPSRCRVWPTGAHAAGCVLPR